MLFTSAVFAALATGGLAAALPGGNGGGWGYGQCKAWDYSSTCSKVYTTKTQSWVKPETSVYTTTTYKPSTVTLTSESTSYETVYSTIVKTHTKYETKTKKIPYKSESHTVVCYTKPVWVWTHSTSLYTSTEKYPVTSKTSSVETEVTKVPHTVITSTPCPETLTSSYKSTYYVTKTIFVSKGCSTTSSCQIDSSCLPSHNVDEHKTIASALLTFDFNILQALAATIQLFNGLDVLQALAATIQLFNGLDIL
ncbi:hypothetical protein LTR15_009228 [Elasticomyces elasticus]|nr:hypothetical protein LTR15_009228 [Elasticomyces elasticus]